MKTRGTIASICALCLALVGCGGAASSGSTTSAASGSAAASSATSGAAGSATSAVAAVTTPVGSWKPAGMEMQGIQMIGDLSQAASIFGGDDEVAQMTQMVLTLAEDGTGTMQAGSQTIKLTWKEAAAGITLTIDTVSGEKSEAKASLADGVLKLSLDENNTLLMTPDGTYPGGAKFDMSAATPVTSESALSGTWKIKGAGMMGLSLSGDDEALTEMFGYDDATVTFSAGGKAKIFGEDSTYTVDASGTKLALAEGDSAPSVAILSGGEYLYLDMSSALGTQVFFVLGK